MRKKRSTKIPYKKIKSKLKWLDAVSKTGWLTKKEMDELKPSESYTTGYIYEETDEYIKTFGTYSVDEEGIEFGEVLCIPKNWI